MTFTVDYMKYMKDDSPESQDLYLELNQKMFIQERYVDAAHW